MRIRIHFSEVKIINKYASIYAPLNLGLQRGQTRPISVLLSLPSLIYSTLIIFYKNNFIIHEGLKIFLIKNTQEQLRLKFIQKVLQDKI